VVVLDVVFELIIPVQVRVVWLVAQFLEDIFQK
jgi:hypothetical protein